MGNIKHIILTIAGSTVLVAGLVFYFDQKDASDRLVSGYENGNQVDMLNGPLTAKEQLVYNPEITNSMNPKAILNTNRGMIELELFAEQMPITTGNFISLAESGFYDGVKFHRVIPNFMIQSGDPNSKGDNELTYGTGGSEKIQDEFVAGEKLTNTRGTIAMANTGQPNSGSSQWFINLVDNTGLDFDKAPLSSKHPVFGQVISGMEVVDQIGVVETKANDVPVDPVVIESIEIVRGE